jgi:hypothetical protein
MFTYSQVERALAAVHQVPPSGMGSFRGRIRHFQRLGMVPSSPGMGRKISYEMQHVYTWGFALELSEFGIDPSVIKVFTDSQAGQMIRDLVLLSRPSDRYFIFYPNMLSRWFQNEGGQHEWAIEAGPDDLAKLADADPKFLTRAALINMSHMRREIDKALVAVTGGGA